jgi:hypothetical protein
MFVIVRTFIKIALHAVDQLGGEGSLDLAAAQSPGHARTVVAMVGKSRTRAFPMASFKFPAIHPHLRHVGNFQINRSPGHLSKMPLSWLAE